MQTLTTCGRWVGILPTLVFFALTTAGGLCAQIPHPRIFLDDAYKSQLLKRVAAADPSWLEFKAKADYYASLTVAPFSTVSCADKKTLCFTGGADGSYHGSGWYYGVIYMGIAYQMTGNTTYSSKVREILTSIRNSWDGRSNCSQYPTTFPPSVNTGYAWRYFGPALAWGFDWVYDQLTDAEKQSAVATAACFYDWSWANNPNSFRRHQSTFNYSGGFLLGIASMGYAMEGDSDRAASDFIPYASSQWALIYGPSWQNGALSGGYPSEGYGSYGFNHNIRMLQYLWMRRTAKGEDLFGSIPDKIVTAMVHALQPNRWRTTHEVGGSMPSGVMWGELPTFLAAVVPNTSASAQAQSFVSQLNPSPAGYDPKKLGAWIGDSAMWHFLYADSSRISEECKLNRDPYYDEGVDHLWHRSNWTDNAIWGHFVYGTGHHTGHQHQSYGHIGIARGADYLLVNGDMYQGLDGESGSAPYEDPYGRVWRSNSLYFDDRGEYLLTGNYYVGGGQPNAVDGDGFRRGIWTGVPALQSRKLTSTFVYAKSDLTSGYDRDMWTQNLDKRTLRYWVRSYAWLGDGYFFVYDRIRAKDATPAYDKRLFWHLPPNTSPTSWINPTVQGNAVTSAVVGNSKLYLNTVLPSTATTSLTYDPATIVNNTAAVFSGSATSRQTFRVEVTDSTGNTFNPLTVFAAIDASEQPPEASAIRIIDGDHVGAIVSGTSPRIAIFAADGALGYSAAFLQAFSGTASILVADLAQGSYRVLQNGSILVSRYEVKANENVMVFTAQGDGTVQHIAITPLP